MMSGSDKNIKCSCREIGYSDQENTINISISSIETVLNTSILNSIDEHSKILNENAKGIGLTNLNRRLELLYPGKYQLTKREEKDFYEINLTLDIA